MTVKILAFSGSTRRGSVNQKLLVIAAEGAVHAGAQVVSIRLSDYPLPIYDGDLERETELPDNARALQQILGASDALLIASPEYNGGYSALLKNTLDWMSRPSKDGGAGQTHFAGKPVAVVSASPGPLGGARGQIGLRNVLGRLGMLPIPQEIALGHANDAFDGNNKLKDDKTDALVRGVGAALAKVAQKLAS
jgi:NAD(P)H-dependent FMN reductase